MAPPFRELHFEARFIWTLAGPMYDFFAQASSLHTNEQAGAIKFYVELVSVQINRASILELSVHSKCPVLNTK